MVISAVLLLLHLVVAAVDRWSPSSTQGLRYILSYV